MHLFQAETKHASYLYMRGVTVKLITLAAKKLREHIDWLESGGKERSSEAARDLIKTSLPQTQKGQINSPASTDEVNTPKFSCTAAIASKRSHCHKAAQGTSEGVTMSEEARSLRVICKVYVYHRDSSLSTPTAERSCFSSTTMISVKSGPPSTRAPAVEKRAGQGEGGDESTYRR